MFVITAVFVGTTAFVGATVFAGTAVLVGTTALAKAAVFAGTIQCLQEPYCSVCRNNCVCRNCSVCRNSSVYKNFVSIIFGMNSVCNCLPGEKLIGLNVYVAKWAKF